MNIMLWICQKLVQGSFGIEIASEKKYDILDTLRNIIPYDCCFDNMLGHSLAHDVKDVFNLTGSCINDRWGWSPFRQ